MLPRPLPPAAALPAASTVPQSRELGKLVVMLQSGRGLATGAKKRGEPDVFASLKLHGDASRVRTQGPEPSRRVAPTAAARHAAKPLDSTLLGPANWRWAPYWRRVARAALAWGRCLPAEERGAVGAATLLSGALPPLNLPAQDCTPP